MSSTSRWTYDQYAKIPLDGLRHEIMDGAHVVNAAPNLYHQTVSRRLLFQLYSEIELAGLGQVFDAPVDVQLSPHDIVQPDLVVVTTAREAILTPAKIDGPPDLVIEIVSPSNPDHERVHKRALYQRFGIPEYWIVDPERRDVEQCLLQENGQYTSTRHTGTITTGTITMVTPPQTQVDLHQVWHG